MRRPLHLAFALAWLLLAGLAAAAGPSHGGAPGQVDVEDVAGLAAGPSVIPGEAWQIALETEDSLPDAAPPLPDRVPRVPGIRPTAPRPPACAAWQAPIPILLLTQRQNE